MCSIVFIYDPEFTTHLKCIVTENRKLCHWHAERWIRQWPSHDAWHLLQLLHQKHLSDDDRFHWYDSGIDECQTGAVQIWHADLQHTVTTDGVSFLCKDRVLFVPFAARSLIYVQQIILWIFLCMATYFRTIIWTVSVVGVLLLPARRPGIRCEIVFTT